MTYMLDRILSERIKSSAGPHLLLLGARQVGKSTLCRGLNPDVTVNLADERLFIRYAKDPALLARELEFRKDPSLVLIDEIQRVPALLNSVQLLIDEGRVKHRFVLTGSSARKLRTGGANLLPGRVVLEYLDPLTTRELGDAFDLDRALRIGTLPGIYLEPEHAEAKLRTYVDVYLREEVRAEALVKNVGEYARFLDVAAIVSGQWLNYSKLASDTEIPKETIRRFVGVLEDTLLAHRLPSFKPRTRLSRRATQRDRLLIFDIGVRNALLGLHGRPLSQDQFGPMFEHWLMLQSIYLNRALALGWTISGYRSSAGAEVDLVIETPDELWGVEIKSGHTYRKAFGRGLRSLEGFINGYKPLRKFVVYRGDTPQQDNDILVLPYRDFLALFA